MNHRLLLAGALCLAQNASAQLELVPHTADDPFIGQGQISVFADFETFHQYFIGNVQGLYPNEFTAVGHFPDGDSWTRATLSSYGSHDSDYAEWNGVNLELTVADAAGNWSIEKLTYKYYYNDGLFSDLAIDLSNSDGANQTIVPADKPPAPTLGPNNGNDILDYLLLHAHDAQTLNVPDTGGWSLWLAPVALGVIGLRLRRSQ